MYPATSFQNTSRPGERRSNLRHRVSSIIYAQLGSDNGGIVVNLGMEGVGVQAAMRLNAARNSILNVRLRGSGLDVNLVGELVWLGATQKEVGLNFKNLSPNAHQDIADWLARETQLSGTAGLQDRARPKPMPTMPGIAAKGEKGAPHSLSAALAKAQEISVVPPSSAVADANESCLPAPLDSATGIFDGTPSLEIVSPNQQSNIPADPLESQPQDYYTNSFASPEQPRVEQPLHNEPVPELSPVERPHESPAALSSLVLFSEEAIPRVREDLLKAPAEPPAKSELSKTEVIAPMPRDQVPPSPDPLREASAAERWIPPALLVAWRYGNRQQRMLVASTGAACLVIFAVILTLALVHIDSSSGTPVGSGSLQQSTAGPAATNDSVGSIQTVPLQTASAPPATVPPRSHRPQPSLLEDLANNILGRGSDESPGIDEDQVRVQVWTSKSSGYYYCTDTPYYKTVQPGTFMTQFDALQSGYRPRLGQFCD